MKIGALIGGKYRLSRTIGKGAMGTVWAAVNELTSREVAIKLICDSTQDLRIRLMREAKACGSLSHRNIIEVLDVGQTDTGDPFLVMPLLHGETLAEHLDRNRRVAPATAAQIARDIARALSVAHRVGIVHRDLKPANIFLHQEPGTEGFVVKVLDFGVSKNLHNREAIATVAGGSIGSPAYMSPEQINPEGKVDFLSDIWSLGVVLFEMLTGQRPFQGDAVQVLTRVTLGEIPRVSKHLWRIDPALDELVAHCLERDPKKRIPSAEEVTKALDAYLANEVSQITTASPLSQNPSGNAENARPFAIGLQGTIAMDDAPPDVRAARASMRKPEAFANPPPPPSQHIPSPSLPTLQSAGNESDTKEEDDDENISTVPVNIAMLAGFHHASKAGPAQNPSPAPFNPAPSKPPAPAPKAEGGTDVIPIASRTRPPEAGLPLSPPLMNPGAGGTTPLQAAHLLREAAYPMPAPKEPPPSRAAPGFGPPSFGPPPAPKASQAFPSPVSSPAMQSLQNYRPPAENPNPGTLQLPAGDWNRPKHADIQDFSLRDRMYGGYPPVLPSSDRSSTTSASGALQVPTLGPDSTSPEEEENIARKRGQRLMLMVGLTSAMVVAALVLLVLSLVGPASTESKNMAAPSLASASASTSLAPALSAPASAKPPSPESAAASAPTTASAAPSSAMKPAPTSVPNFPKTIASSPKPAVPPKPSAFTTSKTSPTAPKPPRDFDAPAAPKPKRPISK